MGSTPGPGTVTLHASEQPENTKRRQWLPVQFGATVWNPQEAPQHVIFQKWPWPPGPSARVLETSGAYGSYLKHSHYALLSHLKISQCFLNTIQISSWCSHFQLVSMSIIHFFKFFKLKIQSGTSLVQWLRLLTPSAVGPGLIPDQGTRSHVMQLRVCMLKLKILRALTKAWHSQINKYLF